MTQEHTEGPWEIGITPETGYYSIMASGREVCGGPMWFCTQDESFDDETEANVHLIANAPALLAALDTVLPDLKHYTATHGPGPDRRLEQAQAAIAAARGE